MSALTSSPQPITVLRGRSYSLCRYVPLLLLHVYRCLAAVSRQWWLVRCLLAAVTTPLCASLALEWTP